MKLYSLTIQTTVESTCNARIFISNCMLGHGQPSFQPLHRGHSDPKGRCVGVYEAKTCKLVTSLVSRV